jgi:alpha-tubulin suppressor-like RCC1 family protein
MSSMAVCCARTVASIVLAWIVCTVSGCSDPVATPGTAGPALAMLATGYVLAPGESSIASYVVVAEGTASFGPGSGRLPASTTPASITGTPANILGIDPVAGSITATAPGHAALTVALTGSQDTASATVLADPSLSAATATHVAVGLQHACARLVTGVARCWGGNSQGQLGSGAARDFTATLSPAPIAFPPPLGQVSAGAFHSCALTPVGQAVCWGENTSGQVNASGERLIASPTSVASSLRFATLGAGGTHTCGLTPQGTVHCWGLQLQAIRQMTGPRFASLSVGFSHACALDETGIAYCWGTGQSGQLGTGSAQEAQPKRIASSERFASISAGTGHTCGVTLTERGLCWGAGSSGQLGTGTFESSARPVEVQLVAPLAYIDAGQSHTCGVTTAGVGYCWGSNLRGQLGIGPPIQSDPRAEDLIHASPRAVAGGTRFRTIAAGRGEFTCGIALDQHLLCWGLNTNGTLGSGRLILDPRVAIAVSWVPVAVRMAP